MPPKKNSKNPRRVIRILESLAQGIDPYTDEVLSETSPFNNVETVRALYRAIKALKFQMEQNPDPADMPRRAGKSWDKQEHQKLFEGFRQGLTIAELAEKHERTNGAIEAQLLRFVIQSLQEKLQEND